MLCERSQCKVLKGHYTVVVCVKMSVRTANSKTGIFNYILNIICVAS